MDDHMGEQIFKLLQQIEMRLARIEDSLKNQGDYYSVTYDDPDPMLVPAVNIVLQHQKASASLFQRHLQIGYARSARILDQLEKAGIVGIGIGANPRKVFSDKGMEYLAKHEATNKQDEAK